MRSEGEINAELVAAVQALSPVPLDLGADTVEGAILTAVSTAAAEIEQGAQIARDDTNSGTATGDALTSIAAGQGVFRREATQSRYEGRTVDGPATLFGGELLRGGGPAGDAEWTVITTGVLAAGDAIVFEAVDSGALALGGATTFTMVTTVPGLTEIEWDPGTDPEGQVGRDRETDAQLRARLAIGGEGLLAELRGLSWVAAATAVTTAPGEMDVTIAPAPVGTDQTDELIDTIGRHALGIVTNGTESGTYEPTGDTVRWDEGTTDPIPVALTIVPASGHTVAELSAAVQAAVDGYAATFAIGGVAYRQRVIAAALTVANVADVTACTLDGVAGNYTPAGTDIVLFSSITVS